ncbi:hypothetical protein QFC21_004668 [Naganishia friedmannii]|uniref:Uncharacterized protein n=1 Tax=Naganishia friedmannii TaxID=89922 RepID=A0ACC2VFB5_9TREE|nr:hypothetical protein QFC21_004668 [Naganishia friedmannii]
MTALINSIILCSIALLLYWVFSNQPKKISNKAQRKSPSKSPQKVSEHERQSQSREEQDAAKPSADIKQSPRHRNKSDRSPGHSGDVRENFQQPVERESSARQNTNVERSSRRVRSYLGGEEPNEESQRSRRKWPAEETASLLLEPGSFEQPAQNSTTTSPSATNHRKKRALDASTSDEDDQRERTSSRRTSKRDIKRKKHDNGEKEAKKEDDSMDTAATTLPGGYIDTDIDIDEEPRPAQGHRRKRDETSDSEDAEDAGDDDDESKSARERHRLHGRAVRRRQAEDTIENDGEMTLVQRSSRRSKRTKNGAGNAKVPSEEATSEQSSETSVTESGSGGEEMEVDSLDGRTRPPISLGLRATPFNETSTDDDDGAEEDDEYATFLRTPNSERNTRTRTTSRQTRKQAAQTSASIRKSKALAVAAAKKKHAKETPQSRRVSSRRKGEVWTEANGQKFKISTRDGVRRQLVSVKEWQHKYKMPADSVHPDKDVMHLVLVEKWVTAAELKELERVKLLGWQSDDTESRNGNNDDLNSIGEVEVARSPIYNKAILNKSLYNHESPQSLGPATPLTAASLIALSASLSKNGTPTSMKSTQQLQQTILRPEAQLRTSTLRAHRSRPQLRGAMAEDMFGRQ